MREEREAAVFRHDLCLSPEARANFAYGETDTNPKKGMVINMTALHTGAAYAAPVKVNMTG